MPKYSFFIILYIITVILGAVYLDQKIDTLKDEQRKYMLETLQDLQISDNKTITSVQARATTLEELSIIPGNKKWIPTKLKLLFNKTIHASNLFYTNQITFQSDTNDLCGAQFKMKVKNEKGIYIMPDMITGANTHKSYAYYNAMLSDTVFHESTNGVPPKGNYTFELWALAGCGNLTIVPYMSNIVVIELPEPELKQLGMSI